MERYELIDGGKCAIRDGRLWIPGAEGKEWTPADHDNPAHKWYWAAFVNSHWVKEDGIYYAVGPHFNGNPYGLDEDFLEKQGRIKILAPLVTETGIEEYLRENPIYGIVFCGKSGRIVRIVRRTQYGLRWPVGDEDGRDGNG